MSLAGHLLYGLRAGKHRWNETLRWEAFLAANPLGPGEAGLLARQGIGDHWLACAFASEIRKAHGFDVGVVAGNPRYAFIGSLFPKPLRYAGWLESEFDEQRSNVLAAGKFFYAHFPNLDLMRAVGHGGFHFLDAYRCRLGLPMNALPATSRPPSVEELTRACTYLEKNRLPPERTVVLCCDARTTPTTGIDAAFWLGLVARLRADGLTPVLNAGPSTPPLQGVVSLPIALADFRPVVQAAGAVCSVRSGLSDLVCDVPCRRAVVYPDVAYWGGRLHPSTTFSHFGLASPPFEILVRPDAVPAAQDALAAALR